MFDSRYHLTSMAMVYSVITEEAPKYTLVRKGPDYEIRRYDRMFVARVRVENLDESIAFRTLSSYLGVISIPENISRRPVPSRRKAPAGSSSSVPPPESIPMTSPVISTPDSKSDSSETSSFASDDLKSEETLDFVLPSKFTSLDQIPIPTDSRVQILEIPGRTMATRTFSGAAHSTTCGETVKELLDALERDGFTVCGPWSLARYNGPYTLPQRRINEILVPIESKETSATSSGSSDST